MIAKMIGTEEIGCCANRKKLVVVVAVVVGLL
jgi:hypothetical protein